MRTLILSIFTFAATTMMAQVGEYRNDFAIGFNGGYALNTIAFQQEVSQSMHGGMTAGFTARYVCEKYFKSICALQAEVNITQLGWKEKIEDVDGVACVNNVTGLPEQYQRDITYVQIPLFAQLGWGREVKGAKAFFQIGPQIGFKLSEKTKTNFAYQDAVNTTPTRVNTTHAQDSMAVENTFDFGIVGGLGFEYSVPKVGHFIIEGRFYYGLGNIYGDSKKDFFARSNHQTITVKMTYLFDIIRTRGAKRK